MLLSGTDLVGFIQERQTIQAHRLNASLGTAPKLVILQASTDPVIDTFVRMKRRYGEEIGVAVEQRRVEQKDLLDEVKQNNVDPTVHGVIIQLPLPDMSQSDAILNELDAAKDVDGLGKNAHYDSATATAILWLLAGYNIDLRGKHIVIVGQGRLVGAPLTELLRSSGHEIVTCDETTEDLKGEVQKAQILITATGVPRLIKSDWIEEKVVVVDAGTASEQGVLVGDVEESARERDDIKVTPLRGGVGPLTIAVLFDHLLRATTLSAKVVQNEK
jgi:methylenetetrahydrofolate dehydrogenase (NADP+)/methenyltetrahydrofolate cyclohydrolase